MKPHIQNCIKVSKESQSLAPEKIFIYSDPHLLEFPLWAHYLTKSSPFSSKWKKTTADNEYSNSKAEQSVGGRTHMNFRDK